MKQRMLSLLLCCVIFCSAFSGDTLTGKAKEKSQEDSCSLEVHKHTEECYQLETHCLYQDEDEAGSPPEAGEVHTCTEESGCVTRVLVCSYAENEEEETVPGDEGEKDLGNEGEQVTEDNKEPEGEEEPAVILSWEWIDEEEVLVWSDELDQWGLGLPGASEENPVTAENLAEILPASITASLGEEQTEILILDWDFSVLPEEGVKEGSYELTAGLPEGYVLGDEAAELRVALEISGGMVYPDIVQAVDPVPGQVDKFVNEWEYVWEYEFKGSSKVKIENYRYFADYYLTINSSKLDEEILIQKLKATLPKKIFCKGSNSNNSLINAGFIYGEKQDPSYGKVEGYVNIEWNVEEVVKGSGSVSEGKQFIFDAMPISNEGYRIRVNTNDPDWDDSKGDEADTAETKGVLNFTVTLHDMPLEGHIISSVNPANTTVNLFDYWVDADGATKADDILAKNDVHVNASGVAVDRTGVDDWDKGINKGRLFLFGDGNIHAGFWNKGAGAGTAYGKKYAGMSGIVERVLKDGYPFINMGEKDRQIADYDGISDYNLCGDHDNEKGTAHTSINPKNISDIVSKKWEDSKNTASLDYLFDPKISHTNKRSYENVKGLFQIDNNGYYYYDMRRNFAEYDKGSNQFILYDAPAVDRTDANYEGGDFSGGRSIGNFFPFNTGIQVFDTITIDAATNEEKLSNSKCVQSSNLKTNGNYMNHHLGMTINIDFRQPLNGKINTGAETTTPMTFQFSGDDDVWIFIDDVLVLDLGGIHSEIYGTIDFSDGTIRVGQSWKTNGFPYKSDGTVDLSKLYADAVPTETTTLLEQFKKAGKEDTTLWNGDTFASNTSHTLKMFYLERGNYDSSLALRFNLQTPLYQQVKKVDQSGAPLSGVEFNLYPATEKNVGANDPGAIECFYTDHTVAGNQTFYVKQLEDSSLIHLKTASDGTSRFLDEAGNYFNFADRGASYYILKEAKTPTGYRKMPVDIVLYYDPATSMLSVANRWTTGAYACSVVHIAGTGSLNYGRFKDNDVERSDKTVNHEKQKDSLVIAVPLLHRKQADVWEPLYGSNLYGFTVSEIRNGDFQKAVLYAALMQTADDRLPNWNLTWDADNLRLSGTLNDLPGLANRYTFMNPTGGDMQMLYGIIEPEALEALGIQGSDAEERYAALGRYVREHEIDDAISKIINTKIVDSESGNGFSLLNRGQFSRDFRSLIYIPNEQRELWVMKIDQNGIPRNGARFGLYNNPQCTGTPVAQGTTGTVNEQEGTLIFSPANNNSSGHAQIGWESQGRTHYYLKEMSAPSGCEMNNTVIPIVVGAYSIYADAGTQWDGVSVMAGVGRLTQVMRQYAMADNVDITLRDITAIQQQQPSSKSEVFPGDWEDAILSGTGVPRSMNLHFGKNTVIDYGLHNEDGGELYKPYFITDTGFIRARVQQNWEALNNDIYEGASNDANKDNLGNADITNLFSLLNIVVVTDPTTQDTNTGRLAISKTVSNAGSESDYTKNFIFTVHLTDKDGKELPGKYYFYGTDKAGYISSGEEFPLHHDEQITILGIPAGTRFTVTEKADSAQGWYVLPETGTVSEEIIRDATSFAPFFNNRNPWGDVGVLIVHKAVAGSGDRTKEFTFTITFIDEDGNTLAESFPYTGEKSGTISSGDSVKLRHDEHIIISGLPAGTQYTVSEEEADQDGYVTSSRGESGVIVNKEVHTAIFINRKEGVRPPAPDPGKPSNPGGRSGDGSGPSPTHSVDPVKTGDMTKLWGFLIVMVLGGLGFLGFTLWKKPQKNYVKWIQEKAESLKNKN